MEPGAADEPAWHRDDAEVGWSAQEKWRRRLAWLTGMSLPLLAVLSGIPHKRAPRPREYFKPGDLTAGWWTFALWTLMGIFVVSLIAWRQRMARAGPPPRKIARLDVIDDELRIDHGDETRAVALGDIEHVFYDEAERATVIRMRGGEVATVAGHGGEHRRLLTALGIDPKKKTATFPVGSLASNIPGGLSILRSVFAVAFVVLLSALTAMSGALISGKMAEAASWVPWLFGSYLTLVLDGWLLRRRSLVVGIDGVQLEGVLRRQFIPLDDVDGVMAAGERGFWVKRKGKTGHLYLTEVPDGGGLGETISRSVESRDQAGHDPAEPIVDLERGERSAEAWRDDVGKLTKGAYRAKRLRIADLEALVEDPTADPEQRVAAAVALSPNEDAKARIRIAAQACADTDMRAALEAAAEGEIALGKLERAQRRLGDES